ncbi:MAG: DNA polymerase III subunit chi [Rhodospirillales bacterium]
MDGADAAAETADAANPAANPAAKPGGGAAEVWFYHLERSQLSDVLPKLLMKTLESGARAVVKAGSPERAEELSAELWTFDSDAWLPHGAAKDGRAADQPVWLTAEDENPNGASYLFLCDGAHAEPAAVARYTRCFDLFNGRDAEAKAAARARWKAAQDAGLAPAYWRQDAEGRWNKQEI